MTLQRSVHRPFRFLLQSVVVAAASTVSAVADDLEIHFLNVGQGHATLIVSPDGTTVLMDGGNPGDGNSVIVPYLQSIGINTIHYGVASHYHSDHIGGMDEVFNAGFGPAFVCYDRGNLNIPNNGNVAGYLASIAGQRQTPLVGFEVFIGGGASMEFVVLNGQYPTGSVDPWSGDQGENASSVGIVVRYGDFDAWIGGDLTGGGNNTANVESGVSAYVGQVEAVLANHHGSNTSSNVTFVANLDPSFVVYSCGTNNPFGHPTQTITNRWNAISASRVHWSTTQGANNGSGGYNVANSHIVLTTDGDTFQVRRVGSSDVLNFATHEQVPPTAAPGDIVISELLVDPAASSDTFGEWVELTNVSNQALTVDQMRFEAGFQQYTVAATLVAEPGERFVFGADGRESRNGNVFPAHNAPWGNGGNEFELSNGSSSLVMRAASGTIMETVFWNAGGFPVLSGISAEREVLSLPPDASNFSPAINAWSNGDLGTPGEVNDNEVPGCGSATPYCVAGANSVGPGAAIAASGSFNVNANDLVLEASGAPASQFGIFYYGPQSAQIPFGDGFRCVNGQVFRLPVIQTTIIGSAQFALDVTDPPQPSAQINAGATWFFQFWYRDPQGPGGSGFNLSDALEILFCAQ